MSLVLRHSYLDVLEYEETPGESTVRPALFALLEAKYPRGAQSRGARLEAAPPTSWNSTARLACVTVVAVTRNLTASFFRAMRRGLSQGLVQQPNQNVPVFIAQTVVSAREVANLLQTRERHAAIWGRSPVVCINEEAIRAMDAAFLPDQEHNGQSAASARARDAARLQQGDRDCFNQSVSRFLASRIRFSSSYAVYRQQEPLLDELGDRVCGLHLKLIEPPE